VTEKTSITVSIDLNDEHEMALYNHVMSKGSRKKSGYIKRLIHADMIGENQYQYKIKSVVMQDDVEDEDKEAMLHSF
jgi:hypothetical protein